VPRFINDKRASVRGMDDSPRSVFSCHGNATWDTYVPPDVRLSTSVTQPPSTVALILILLATRSKVVIIPILYTSCLVGTVWTDTPAPLRSAAAAGLIVTCLYRAQNEPREDAARSMCASGSP
jgi:hypothetical protein